VAASSCSLCAVTTLAGSEAHCSGGDILFGKPFRGVKAVACGHTMVFVDDYTVWSGRHRLVDMLMQLSSRAVLMTG
jgi:hypothetical protein